VAPNVKPQYRNVDEQARANRASGGKKLRSPRMLPMPILFGSFQNIFCDGIFDPFTLPSFGNFR
jgi:hypothetical protein